MAASVATARPALAAKAAASPRPGLVQYAFLHGDWRLSSDENAAVEAALRAVARRLGQRVLPPEQVRPPLERLRQGWTGEGTQCAVPRTRSAELLAALQADPALCPGQGCSLREVSWSIECSARWDACAVDLRFRAAPAGADPDAAEDDGDDAALHYSWRAPRSVAQAWKGVADLARGLAASRTADWRQPGSEDGTSNVFGVGGLLGSLLGGEETGHRSRAMAPPAAYLEVQRTAGARAALWSLLVASDAHGSEARRIALDPSRIGCFQHPALEARTSVFARRSSRGLDVAIEHPEPALRACLEPMLRQALQGEDKGLVMLNLDLVVEQGDVVSRDGQYLIELSARQERTQDPDWRKQKPRVSDPALEDWLLPRSQRAFAQCLVDFPFSDDYALQDSKQQARLHLFYEVRFDAQGRATAATFLLPAKKNSPAQQLSAEARACIERAALASTAPCSREGGTARAWLSVSVSKLLRTPSTEAATAD